MLLVDVDGVLSLYSAGSSSAVVGTLVDGIPHLLSRPAAAALRSVVDVFECAWCTGWEDRAGEHLPGLLDLPRGWPFVRFPDEPAVDAHWKLAGIDAFAGSSRPLAWIDDAHDEDCHAWAAARPGPTLLVTCAPDVGLTAAHADTLRAWAAALPSRPMGAWGEGNLENDTALDWLGDLEDAPDVQTVVTSLRLPEGYVDADVGAEALVAAELVACALGQPPDGEHSDRVARLAERWPELAEERAPALSALAAVADPERSELHELWHEDDGAEWDAVLADLRRRLEG